MNRHFLHPGCILKTSPPSNDALWLFSFHLCWFSTLMIISKLLFIIAILVLCRVLPARCVKSQYRVTIITTVDNLLCLQELCQAGRWGNLNAPARGATHFLSFEYFWVQKILWLNFHVWIAQSRTLHTKTWTVPKGPHRATPLAPGEPQQLQGRWQPQKLQGPL